MTYRCEKCQNTRYETGEIRTAGGRLSKLFDVQNKKFMTVSCSECGFTEIYKGNTSLVGNVFDLMVGG